MKRMTIVWVVIFVLAGLWCWRYVWLNQYWKSMAAPQYKIEFEIGDVVPIGPDLLDKYGDLTGYSIRVNDFMIVDPKELMESFDLTWEEARDDSGRKRQKIALVYITLFNKDCDADGIMLTNIPVHGIDSTYQVDWPLLQNEKINPILEGYTGIHLPHNSECELILPYTIQPWVLAGDWNHIDQYNFYLHITGSPTEKDILLQ